MDIRGINKNLNSITAGNILKKSNADQSFEDTLKNLEETGDEKSLKKACMDFEAIFLRMMYKQMRQSIPKSGLIPESFSTETFEEMFDEKIADEVVKGKGIGLGQSLYNTLKKQLNRSKTPDEE